MKNLKKYILAIVMCICLMFTSLTGCAHIQKDNSKALEEKAITIGSTVLSKQEVINLWYNFYNGENTSYLFYYMEEDQILEQFYKNVVVSYAVMEETKALIVNETLVYSTADDANVWKNVMDGIYKNLDTIEKSLYKQQGTEDKMLPTRLQTEQTASSDVKSYLYTEYNFTGMEDYACKYLKEDGKVAATNYGDDVKDERIDQIVKLLERYIYKEAVKLSDDEELEFDNVNDLQGKVDNTGYFTDITDTANRETAYQMYLSQLLMNAKASGKKADKAEVLSEEIKRLYVSYYESYLTSMYSNYINSLVDKAGSEYYSLNDQAIVSRYLQLVGRDVLKYELEDNYIAFLEAKPTNSLLLYHYEGEYYYFSVQHLLVSFDNDITTALKNMFGNSANASKDHYEFYEDWRNTYYDHQLGLNSWADYNNATYRDENGYDVYVYTDGQNQKHNVYFDKDYVLDEEEYADAEDSEKPNGYYYTNDGSEKVYLTAGEFEKCKQATVKLGKVLNDFNKTYATVINTIATAITTNVTDLTNEENLKELAETIHESLEAIAEASAEKETLVDGDAAYTISLDFVEAYLRAYIKAVSVGKDTTEGKKIIADMNYKVYSNLFMQHSFKYSYDSASLGTELSDYVGMIISARPDNHAVGGSTYVNEFTDKARELAEQYIAGTYNATTIGEANYAISDYGIHIISVNNVYKVEETGTITSENVTAENIFGAVTQEDIDQYLTAAEKQLTAEEQKALIVERKVAEAVEEMKSTYVSVTSSQTLYEYIYELVRNELIGGTSSKVYTKEQNRLYIDYISETHETPKVSYHHTYTYQELMDAIS